MKPASVALETLLETGVFIQADLYTIHLSTGLVLRYTTADLDITDGTFVWTSQGPYVDEVSDDAARGHWKVGLDVDSWAVRVMPRQVDDATNEDFPDKIGSMPWLQAARAGLLSGATFTVDRAYAAAWPQPWKSPFLVTTPYILAKVFYGLVAAVDLGVDHAILTANDFRDILGIAMPRNLYGAPCRFTLFDAGCTLNPATYAVAGAALHNTTTNTILATLAQAAGYFDLGRLVMTSGLNNGLTRPIRRWDGAGLKMMAPLPYLVAAGDTFTVYPGCDRSKSTCTNKFANGVNYGGQRFIPAPETAA